MKTLAIAARDVASKFSIRDIFHGATHLNSTDLFPMLGGCIDRNSRTMAPNEIFTMLA
jgi:hypothetical protein